MDTASRRDREYFARIGRLNRALSDDRPPESLAEMFERMATLRRNLGGLADPGVDDPEADGDLESHLAFLARVRAISSDCGRPRS